MFACIKAESLALLKAIWAGVGQAVTNAVRAVERVVMVVVQEIVRVANLVGEAVARAVQAVAAWVSAAWDNFVCLAEDFFTGMLVSFTSFLSCLLLRFFVYYNFKCHHCILCVAEV